MSEARFPGMSYSEDDELPTIVLVADDVCAIAERDDPLPEFGWQIVDSPADVGVPAQATHREPNAGNCPPGCIRVPRCQEGMQTRHVP